MQLKCDIGIVCLGVQNPIFPTDVKNESIVALDGNVVDDGLAMAVSNCVELCLLVGGVLY